ncbi:hypothetical protein, partial [Plasmodium yoelii yoelii]
NFLYFFLHIYTFIIIYELFIFHIFYYCIPYLKGRHYLILYKHIYDALNKEIECLNNVEFKFFPLHFLFSFIFLQPFY